MKGKCFFVRISVSGESWRIPFNPSASGIPKSRYVDGGVIIKSNKHLSKIKYSLLNDLVKLGKDAPETAPDGLISVRIEKLAETKVLVENYLNEIEEYKNDMVANYDSYKEEDFDNLKKAIENLSTAQQEKIMKSAELRYPSIAELKTRVNLNVSFLCTPINDTDFDSIKSMMESDILLRYKQAIFTGLDPIYRLLGSIAARLDNGLDIHAKTRTALNNAVKTCEEENKIKHDGFTDMLLDYIKKYRDCIFKDFDVAYVAAANIFNEAHINGAETSLTNIEIIEKPVARKVEQLFKKKYTPTLNYDQFVKDAESSKLKDLL